MFFQLVYTEAAKYKRTIIPWIITAGGGFAAFVALMLVITGGLQKNWDIYITRGFNLINILSLLLVAVISGYVFVNEYHEGTAGTVFTYPVSRLKVYFTKFFIILCYVIALYLSFFVTVMLFGLIFIGGIPSISIVFKFIKVILIIVCINYALVPVTVFISIIVRSIGTYILTGLGYFLVYMGFLNSEYSLKIPPCMPDKLTSEFYISEFIGKADINGMIVVLVLTFLSAFLAGAYYYSRHTV